MCFVSGGSEEHEDYSFDRAVVLPEAVNDSSDRNFRGFRNGVAVNPCTDRRKRNCFRPLCLRQLE